jgi:hypothetical protein
MVRFTLCLLVCAFLGACGGGGGGGADLEVTLPSIAALDGIVESDGTVYEEDSYGIALGDGSPGDGWRGFVTFDLGPVPAGADVLEATLRILQFGVEGTPYADLGGAVLVDHVDVGATLDGGDYDRLAIAENIGTLSTDATLEVKSLAVTSAVRADLAAARTRSGFRLRFPVESDVDPGGDYVNFNEQEDPDGSGVTPVLVVRYRLP